MSNNTNVEKGTERMSATIVLLHGFWTTLADLKDKPWNSVNAMPMMPVADQASNDRAWARAGAAMNIGDLTEFLQLAADERCMWRRWRWTPRVPRRAALYGVCHSGSRTGCSHGAWSRGARYAGADASPLWHRTSERGVPMPTAALIRWTQLARVDLFVEPSVERTVVAWCPWSHPQRTVDLDSRW